MPSLGFHYNNNNTIESPSLPLAPSVEAVTPVQAARAAPGVQ
jgi:hypothetical protein